MRKNLLLTCLLTFAAIMGVCANDKWPITLTTNDGLPGSDGSNSMKHFKSRVYTFDEAITTLRYTVVQTMCSTKMPNTSESYDGRATDGPGFAFFALSELRVRDAEGKIIPYTPSSNAIATGDGALENINDGVNLNSHFHSVFSKGSIDGDYHYLELTFAEPIKSFSIEWDTRASWAYNMPSYVGLTPGYSYWPLPEQQLSVEKVTSVDQLAEPGALFVLEGHSEAWDDANKGRTNPGGGFFEAPCLTLGQPSAFGVFELRPVAGAKNTYTVKYLNDAHYIAAKDNNNAGFIDWTMDSRKAMKIKFTEDSENAGDFILTSLEGDSLLLHQDAYMRMGCIANNKSAQNNAKRPFAANFSVYKASVNGHAIADKLQDVISLAESRLALSGDSFDEYDEGQTEALVDAIATAKSHVDNKDVTASEIVVSRNELNDALSAYYAMALYWWIDSVTLIMDGIENGDILTSSAPNWVNNSYPDDSDLRMQEAIDNADIIYESYTSLADIDEAIEFIKKVVDDFWASKITNVKSLPFRIGSEDDGLPGDIGDYGGFVWESPIYYMTGMVDQFRITVFKTNCNSSWQGFPFVTLAEMELYDETGEKIELSEEDILTNSLAKSDGGKGIAGMLDGNTGTYYHGAYSTTEGYDNFNFAANPQYVYFDITLPREVAAFRYVQKGRVYSSTTRKNTPVDFVIGEYGTKVVPEDVPFPDDNNPVLGTKVTDLSEITDDGIYAIMGLINSDPVNGTGEPGCFYQGISRFGSYLQSPCAFTIKSTGEEGTYYIQSLADGKYWSAAIDEDGWGAAASSIFQSQAAKLNIEPNNNENLPNSFVIYMYNDTVKRDGTPHPYIVMQDWGANIGTFSIPSLDKNDKDGEGEWYIYRMSMDNPYSYWLANAVKAAQALGFEYSIDPGYYSNLGTFPEVMTAAQALLSNPNRKESEAKALLAQFDDAIAALEFAEVNPVVSGIYLFENANPEFFRTQKVKKAMYYVTNLDEEAGGDYALSWKNIPDNIYEADSTFYFEFIPAKADDEYVNIWLEDQVIDSALAANAYYIRLCGTDFYVNHRNETDDLGTRIGSTKEPYPYIVRPQKDASFDIWNPKNTGFSLHPAGHSNGAGASGTIVYFRSTEPNSLWYLRLIKATSNGTGIVAPVVDGEEVVSTTYYSTTGVASETPVEGVNIVKFVYSNGVVKTAKFVK